MNKKDYLKEYREENKVELKVKRREYYEKNKEMIKLRQKERYNRDREIILKKRSLYRKIDVQQTKEKDKKNYLKNKEKILRRHKRYYKEKKKYILKKQQQVRLDNIQKFKEKDKRYYNSHKEEKKIYNKRYQKNNRDKFKRYTAKYLKTFNGKVSSLLRSHKYLSKKYGSEFNLRKDDVIYILNRDKVCIYCGSKERLGFDHIIPYQNKGNSSLVNIVIACKSCNSSKRNKEVSQWCKNKGFVLPKGDIL